MVDHEDRPKRVSEETMQHFKDFVAKGPLAPKKEEKLDLREMTEEQVDDLAKKLGMDEIDTEIFKQKAAALKEAAKKLEQDKPNIKFQ